MQEAETFYHINVHCDTTRPYLKVPQKAFCRGYYRDCSINNNDFRGYGDVLIDKH